MHLDEKAQLSIDFLGGFAIVFFSLVTVLLFLPTLFQATQNPSIDLQPVAYRTGVLLAEDMGWWKNSSSDSEGYNWEDHVADTSRVGLVSAKYGKGDQCALNRNKTLGFVNLYNKSGLDKYEKMQQLLGLISSMRRYDFNISFKTRQDNLWVLNVNNTIVDMTFGREIPVTGNVEKVVRIFRIKNGDFYLDIPSINPPQINQNWWPNWPAGHPLDSGDPNGQQDAPIRLYTPVNDFLVYNAEQLGVNVIEFEIYITNNSSLNRNQILKAQGEWVVKWRKNPGDTWAVPGTAYDGSTWIWNNKSGKYEYDFGSYIQGRVNQEGWSGTIYMTIFVQNLIGNVTTSSIATYTLQSDPWIPPQSGLLNSIKMEVCIW